MAIIAAKRLHRTILVALPNKSAEWNIFLRFRTIAHRTPQVVV